jgi:hypothetical protein
MSKEPVCEITTKHVEKEISANFENVCVEFQPDLRVNTIESQREVACHADRGQGEDSRMLFDVNKSMRCCIQSSRGERGGTKIVEVFYVGQFFRVQWKFKYSAYVASPVSYVERYDC